MILHTFFTIICALALIFTTFQWSKAQDEYEWLLDEYDMLEDQQRMDQDMLTLIFEGQYDREEIELTDVDVSAYSSTRRQTDETPHLNASGGNTFIGSLAVSRDLINQGLNFGDVVYLVDIGLFRVDDVMAPRWKHRVDIWCADRRACELFGRRDDVTMIWMKGAE